MRRSTASSLIAVLFLALLLRLSPLARFLYFGSDIGEYFRITQGLVATGHVSLAYPGWGVTYPYFPGMFFVVSGPVFAGLELGGSLDLIVPALGALIPVFVFLIAARILHEDKAALVAAAFLAVAMPHAFQTAHPIPATLGELLAVAILLLFLHLPRDPRTWALLVPLTVALVVTHHLSAYFLLVMLLVGLVVEALVRPGVHRGRLPRVAYVAFLAALALAYWLGYATTFREEILTSVDVRPWWLPLVAFPALLIAAVTAILARRRVSWRYRPRYPSLRRVSVGYAASFATISVLMASAVGFGVPGTDIRLPPAALWFFLPFFAFLSFSGAGRKHADFGRHGLEVSGWFLGLVLSMGFGLVAAPQVIIPYRHVEYVVVVLAVLVGAGLSRVVELGGAGRRRATAFALVAVLVTGSALSAFPPPGLLVNFEEGIRPAAVGPAYWAGGHVDGLLATDHRPSTLVFGFGGVDATWDTAPLSITAPDFASARAEMCAVRSPAGVGRVDYVLIDADLVGGVQLSPFGPASPLSPAAEAKFGDLPYQKVFDSGYAQVYFVNWGYAGAPCP
ncbi:MAG: hypothetical protein A3K65_05255 [Euryarchaeota archaeon RBG_16_68_12]|nr:MAG: hypothetical protein A3K65_05255 [Euryarchaeota archaeon RBG_16_68_12]